MGAGADNQLFLAFSPSPLLPSPYLRERLLFQTATLAVEKLLDPLWEIPAQALDVVVRIHMRAARAQPLREG